MIFVAYSEVEKFELFLPFIVTRVLLENHIIGLSLFIFMLIFPKFITWNNIFKAVKWQWEHFPDLIFNSKPVVRC